MIAPHDTLLGRLQRGRGAGTLAVLADPIRARDDLLACIERDPRHQGEHRGRAYSELLQCVELPSADLVRAIGEQPEGHVGHEVLVAAWWRGYAPVRALLAREDLPAALVDGIAWQLSGHPAATAVWPPHIAARLASRSTEWGDAAMQPLVLDGTESIEALLDLTVVHCSRDGERIGAELLRRVTPADHARLAEVAEHDPEPARSSMAARVLGQRGDDRLLAFAEQAFCWHDPVDDPAHRLGSRDRSRRVAMLRYITALPATCTLPLARRWLGRDDYADLVASRVLARHAEPQDREALEARLLAAIAADVEGCWDEVQGLGRIADPRSAPALVTAFEQTHCSYLRKHAVRALAAMPATAGAEPFLREALWDAEDEAAAIACAAVGRLDREARDRVTALAVDPVATPELRTAAAARLATG